MLVLGSMPGSASLEQGSYYAHPRNRFWPLMAQMGGFDVQTSYQARMRALQNMQVGLWDVIGACERAGSLDTAIRRSSEIANPLLEVIDKLPDLRAIAFNGGKAAEAFHRHITPSVDSLSQRLSLLSLPSTSPANAAFQLPALIKAWAGLSPFLAMPGNQDVAKRRCL